MKGITKIIILIPVVVFCMKFGICQDIVYPTKYKNLDETSLKEIFQDFFRFTYSKSEYAKEYGIFVSLITISSDKKDTCYSVSYIIDSKRLLKMNCTHYCLIDNDILLFRFDTIFDNHDFLKFEINELDNYGKDLIYKKMKDVHRIIYDWAPEAAIFCINNKNVKIKYYNSCYNLPSRYSVDPNKNR